MFGHELFKNELFDLITIQSESLNLHIYCLIHIISAFKLYEIWQC